MTKAKKFTNFRPIVKSRHPSHRELRKQVFDLLPFRSVVRLGSSTKMKDDVTSGGNRVECNTINAIETSSDKLLMKETFASHQILTPEWFQVEDLRTTGGGLLEEKINDLPYPIIAKRIYGSRGRGLKKIETKEEMKKFLEKDNIDDYYFEKYYTYAREYRLHVTQDGYFYACRKMLKEETPEDKRFYRNDSNCVWFLESNSGFDKPVNWDKIVKASVEALKAVELDIGAIDVLVQSAVNSSGDDRIDPKFLILECNSAPSFGEVTLEKYIKEIPKVLRKKFETV